MNKCNTATKLSVVEANIWRWRQQKQKLINTNSTQKSFSVPKNGHFQASEQWTVDYVYPHKRLEGHSHVKQLNIKHGNLPNHKSCGFTSRPAWVGMCDAEEQVLSLQKNFTLPEIACRVCGDSCCFSVTRKWTPNNEQLHPQQNWKYQWNTSVLRYALKWCC